MNPNNRSKADNFKVVSKNFGKQWHHAEFLANINTSSYYDRPFYSLPVVVPLTNQQGLYLALRTEKSVAFLLVTNKIQLKCQMELPNFFSHRFYKISTFEYAFNPIKSENEKVIIIGFANGVLGMFNVNTNQILGIFNMPEINQQQQQQQKELEPFKKQPVVKICTIPFKEQFISCFLDSSMIKYTTQKQDINLSLYQEIEKHDEKIVFDKNLNKFPTKRKKINDTVELGIIKDEHFEMFALFSKDESKNPSAYYKYKCSTISDFIVLTPEHYANKLNIKNPTYEPLLISYVGHDGYFRIVDIHNLQPIFLFKSNYGGINSVVFENQQSPIVALGCQDDSTIILNIATNDYIRITGQFSFISRVVFQEIKPEIIRVISSSYDGSIAIKEIERKMLYESQEFSEENIQSLKLPIVVKYQHKKDRILSYEENEIIEINREGVGYIEAYQNYIFTSAFDGCCSSWVFLDEELPNQNEIQEQQQQQQQNNQNSNGKQQ